VVIPTAGRPAFVAEAVASVIGQTTADWECIVVDDSGSGSDVLPGLRDDPRVRVLRHETNLGVAAARNTGIQAAAGRYLAFLDDDDVFAADRLELALANHERAPLLICRSSWLGSQPEEQRRLEGNVYDFILDTTTPHLGTVTVERARAPEFDPRYRACEDLDWWLKAARTIPVSTVPSVGCLIRRHRDARVGYGTRERIRYSELLLEEHSDYFASHSQARAFRWFRIGLMAAQLGDHRYARRAFVRSLEIRADARTAVHLVRSVRPTAHRIEP
jgi:glycosyltransferase involved in cell wall biosynthesis